MAPEGVDMVLNTINIKTGLEELNNRLDKVLRGVQYKISQTRRTVHTYLLVPASLATCRRLKHRRNKGGNVSPAKQLPAGAGDWQYCSARSTAQHSPHCTVSVLLT